jgi:ankyrin repeat protein
MLKRIIVLIMMAISLFSYSANAAVPSLPPYDSSWTVSQLRGFINAGADVNARDEGGRTPLMVAAFNANPEVIKTLITAGADVNARNDFGSTPLMEAAGYRFDPPILDIMLR